MKGSEAIRIMLEHERCDTGFRVNFDRIEGSMRHSDYFPAQEEDLIPTEEQAWELAIRWAAANRGICINVYVINQNYVPVKGYQERMIKNRDE